MYRVEVDRSRSLVLATLTGFFSIDEVEDFARDEQAAARSLGCRSGEYFVLIEAPSGVIQTQQVVGAFKRLISDAPFKARRIAIVVRGSLYKMQTRRILTEDRSALFDDLADAEAWLFDGIATLNGLAA